MGKHGGYRGKRHPDVVARQIATRRANKAKMGSRPGRRDTDSDATETIAGDADYSTTADAGRVYPHFLKESWGDW